MPDTKIGMAVQLARVLQAGGEFGDGIYGVEAAGVEDRKTDRKTDGKPWAILFKGYLVRGRRPCNLIRWEHCKAMHNHSAWIKLLTFAVREL
jgi:hypothetical protein